MRIVHVTSLFDGSKEDARRNAFARSTWEDAYKLGGWVPCHIPDSALPRLFPEGGRKIPYIKDLLDIAASVADDFDWICLTNSDTCFSSSLHDKLIGTNKPIYAFRRDFPRLTRKLYDKEIKAGNHYVGIDLFFFPAAWWRTHKDAIPDVLIGREGWDCMFKVLMDYAGAEGVSDLIYHETHGSFWEQPHNRRSLDGQIHNRNLVSTWLRQQGFDPKPHGM